MQLMGLFWAAAAEELQPLAKAILGEQQPDDGWRQHGGLPGDAYTTGGSLCALSLAGTPPTSRVYQRGVEYLLKTRHSDGSWFVASHSPRIQVYFEGGFPYRHDLWISNWATSSAKLALTAAVTSPPLRASPPSKFRHPPASSVP
jgi:hypothetical protein